MGSVCVENFNILYCAECLKKGHPARTEKSYHLAGYSFSANMGFQFDFFNHLFLQAKVKAGYMNLTDILTTTECGKANQHFDFVEPIVCLGYSFHL